MPVRKKLLFLYPIITSEGANFKDYVCLQRNTLITIILFIIISLKCWSSTLLLQVVDKNYIYRDNQYHLRRETPYTVQKQEPFSYFCRTVTLCNNTEGLVIIWCLQAPTTFWLLVFINYGIGFTSDVLIYLFIARLLCHRVWYPIVCDIILNV